MLNQKYAVQENEPHVQRILLPYAQIWRLIYAILRSEQQAYLNQLAQQLLFPIDHLIDPLDIGSHILHIFCALQPVFRREGDLRGGSGTAGNDSLFFLHDEDIVCLLYTSRT